MKGGWMLERVCRYSSEKELLHKGCSVIAACSGGPDSLTLLSLLIMMRDIYNINVYAAHFEHGIRGKASLDDAAFVRDFCKDASVPYYEGSADIPKIAAERHVSIETAARDERYSFLSKISRKLGRIPVAVAHHMGDQAETVIMHLLRGSGIDGLSGISPRSMIYGIEVIRPLLCVSKGDILRFCEEAGLRPRHDETNDVPDCLRNSVRLELMPVLREYNPGIIQHLSGLADDMASISDMLHDMSDDVMRRGYDGHLMSIGCLNEASEPVKSEVIRQMFCHAAATSDGLSRTHIRAIIRLANRAQTGEALDLPHGMIAHVSYGMLSIGPPVDENHEDEQAVLNVPGDTSWKSVIIRASYVKSFNGKPNENEAYFDMDKLDGQISVKSRGQGDSISTFIGKKKVKKLLIDAKIPSSQRNDIPEIICNGRILWLAYVKRSDIAMVTSSTVNILHLQVIK